MENSQRKLAVTKSRFQKLEKQRHKKKMATAAVGSNNSKNHNYCKTEEKKNHAVLKNRHKRVRPKSKK